MTQEAPHKDLLQAPAADSELYQDHVNHVLDVYRRAMRNARVDAVVISAQPSDVQFLDDLDIAYKANPHYRYFCPLAAAPGSLLLITAQDQPSQFFVQPSDYWHAPPEAPDTSYTKHFSFTIHELPEQASSECRTRLATCGKTAFIGRDLGTATALGIAQTNPAALLNELHFARSTKTAYELECMRVASRMAAAGHRAAEQTFRTGVSEHLIHCAYLGAVGQSEADLPYPSIVARNHHAGVLHYQHRETTTVPAGSFLIDAGATCNGYASDITRTWLSSAPAPATSAASHRCFASLIDAVDQIREKAIALARPGVPYRELHDAAHIEVANSLRAHDISTLSVAELVDTGITRSFLPHGLGHLLGLQTHDVGGHLAAADGSPAPPPQQDPALRNMRPIAEGQVFTIEPGIYFIPLLLDALRSAKGVDTSLAAVSNGLDWALLDDLRYYGGIRMEDNIHVLANGTENLTRDAFQTLGVCA